MDYLTNLGFENVRNHEESLTKLLFDGLSEFKNLEILGPNYDNIKKRSPLVAFTIKGIHPHDIGGLLNEEGIAIRSGHHCALPIHERLNLPTGSARASFYIYNTPEEIEFFLEKLKKINSMFN